MPSILMKPDCGSKARCNSAIAVDLPAPVGPTSAMVWPGSAAKERSSTAGRLAGERIDDFAEQHRLGELGGRKQQVGAGQDPAKPRFLAEQLEHAQIKAGQGHPI
jgi:hypothetical protein